MKLHFKLQICHQGTKTQRDDMYFNLGALVSLWLNKYHHNFLINQTGVFWPESELK